MVIVLDMDEILVDLISGVNNFYNKSHGTCFTRSDYYTCNWWEVWRCSYEHASEVSNNFINSYGGLNLKPIPGSVDGVQRLRKFDELVVITSRNLEYENLTKQWLEKYHGRNAFKKVCLINEYGENKTPPRKSDVAFREEASLAIEDQTRHALDYASVGIPCILLDHPWNKYDELPSQTIRVYSWSDILREVETMRRK